MFILSSSFLVPFSWSDGCRATAPGRKPRGRRETARGEPAKLRQRLPHRRCGHVCPFRHPVQGRGLALLAGSVPGGVLAPRRGAARQRRGEVVRGLAAVVQPPPAGPRPVLTLER